MAFLLGQTEKSKNRLATLVTATLAIDSQNAIEANTLAYMARAMVIATLPHSMPDGHIFQRINGNFTFSMIANPQFGLPYGSLPRLVLAWITKEVKETKSPVINLGKTFSNFLRALKLSQSGGKRGDATRLRNQMLRLFTTQISCVYHDKKQGVCKTDQYLLARSFEFWWNPLKEKQDAILSTSTITLAKDFYDELIHRPVPVDFRALKAFSRSPLQMDLYVWLTYRFSYLKQTTLIPWHMLSNQFGASYGLLRDFKKGFIKGLRVVIAFYPEARVSLSDEGLVLKPSPTHVKPKTKKMGG